MNPLKPKSELMTIDCDTIRQLKAEHKQHVAIDQINAFRQNIIDNRKNTILEIFRRDREVAYVKGICTRCFFRKRTKDSRWCKKCHQDKKKYNKKYTEKIKEYGAKYRNEKKGFIVYD